MTPGLSTAEAERRLAEVGPNELPDVRRHVRWTRLWEVLREPLILLLVAAGVLYVFFGEPTDAALLLAVVVVIVAIDYGQTARMEGALEALRSMAQPEVLVVRDGETRRVPSRTVVPGDVAVLLEGERVPADGRVLDQQGLVLDESLLTGESVGVTKRPARKGEEWSAPGGDDRPFVYAQTLVLQGRGRFEVLATGGRMEVGRIARGISTIQTDTPILQRQTRALVVGVTVVAISLSLVVAGLVGAVTGEWVAGLLAGVTLAIALLPEEIPVVLTVYTALGARRMAARQALPRRLSAIPTLGAMTVLCVDKTGTLTSNRMELEEIAVAPEETIALATDRTPAEGRDLLVAALRASDPDPHDPIDRGVHRVASRVTAAGSPATGPTWMGPVALPSELRARANRWRDPDGAALVYVKGAPEDVLDLCVSELPRRPAWERLVQELGGRGFRVLGVAVDAGSAATSPVPKELGPGGATWTFRGLVAFADPIRADVPEAIRSCRGAGIRVVMITGDHPETARRIAVEAGMDAAAPARTGPELAGLNDEGLRAVVDQGDVFARVTPEQKLRLVRALRDNGEVVGMTGDGVNDAPALRAADIGIAMGGRGSDVAREASSLVLLDDAFPTIVAAVRSGRRIYANMRKAIGYLLAVHVAIAGMAVLPLLLGLPLLLFPIEIVFLQLTIDPTSALSFEAEPEEADVMSTPPRNPKEPLFRMNAIGFSLLQGSAALFVTTLVYLAALDRALPVPEARALAFGALVIANIFLIFVNRSWTRALPASLRIPNRWLWPIVGFSILLLIAALYFAPLAGLFGFTAPSPLALGVTAALAVLGVVWVEPFKLWFHRRATARGSAVPAGRGTAPGVRP